jgi:hypothetical protein
MTGGSELNDRGTLDRGAEYHDGLTRESTTEGTGNEGGRRQAAAAMATVDWSTSSAGKLRLHVAPLAFDHERLATRGDLPVEKLST